MLALYSGLLLAHIRPLGWASSGPLPAVTPDIRRYSNARTALRLRGGCLYSAPMSCTASSPSSTPLEKLALKVDQVPGCRSLAVLPRGLPRIMLRACREY